MNSGISLIAMAMTKGRDKILRRINFIEGPFPWVLAIGTIISSPLPFLSKCSPTCSIPNFLFRQPFFYTVRSHIWRSHNQWKVLMWYVIFILKQWYQFFIYLLFTRIPLWTPHFGSCISTRWRARFLFEKWFIDYENDVKSPLIFVLFLKGKQNKKENPECDSLFEKGGLWKTRSGSRVRLLIEKVR